MTAKLQSAMEYLMTYGWAILVIAIVLGVLYYFGVFGGVSLGTSCLPSQGYLCNSPMLNSSGYLSINFAVDGSPITLTGINCTSNSTQPKYFQTLTSPVLQSGNIAYITMKCFGGASGPIGKKYNGYIWINYTTATQNSLYARVAIVVATVGSTRALPSSSLVTTTIPYTWGSSTGSTSLTLASAGYTAYICDAGNYNSIISSPSWAVDSNTLYSSVGRQGTPGCSNTAASATAESMAGISLNTSLTPTVVVEAACPSGCAGGAANPTIAKNGTLAFMVMSCGNGGSGCSISVYPSGCTPVVSQTGSSTYGATIILACPSLKAGVQSFSWSASGAYAVMVLYEYHT